MKSLIFLPIALLAGCAPTSPGAPDETPAPSPDIAASPPIALPAPDGQEPQAGDLAPCPGINPDIRRPAGSNCLGITPDQCGADAAQGYVGQMGTPEAREALRRMAVSTTNGDFRWIPYNTPVIEDLRPHRFNVELDPEGRIARIDCY